MDSDQHFIVPGGRFFYLLELKDFWGSVFCTYNRFHLGLLTCFGCTAQPVILFSLSRWLNTPGTLLCRQRADELARQVLLFLCGVGSDGGLLRQLPASDFERQAGGQTQLTWDAKVLTLVLALWPGCDYAH